MKSIFFKLKLPGQIPNSFKAIGLIIIFLLIFRISEKNPLPKTLKDKHRPFVTLAYQGELGNKLFQTANAISYAIENNYRLSVPEEQLNSKTARMIFRMLPFEKKPKYSFLFTEDDPYRHTPIPKIDNVELKGFFISERYFAKHKDLIKSLFSPPKKMRWSLERKYPKLLKHPVKVALHIRTYYKDYLGSGVSLYNHFPSPDLSYYEKAIYQFPEDAIFIVCSDHINWCKKNLSHIPRTFHFIEGQRSIEDFYLLSLCDHMITSNSTFSWWAAYLITNPSKKVIARVPWTVQRKGEEHVIPSSWIPIQGELNPPIPDFDMSY